MNEERKSLGLGDPPLYTIVDAPKGATSREGPHWQRLGDRYQLVHVISPAAGGEVRGYWLIEGTLWLRYPASPEEWPELDAEIARVLAMPVRRWRA